MAKSKIDKNIATTKRALELAKSGRAKPETINTLEKRLSSLEREKNLHRANHRN